METPPGLGVHHPAEQSLPKRSIAALFFDLVWCIYSTYCRCHRLICRSLWLQEWPLTPGGPGSTYLHFSTFSTRFTVIYGKRYHTCLGDTKSAAGCGGPHIYIKCLKQASSSMMIRWTRSLRATRGAKVYLLLFTTCCLPNNPPAVYQTTHPFQ